MTEHKAKVMKLIGTQGIGNKTVESKLQVIISLTGVQQPGNIT